MTSLTDDTLAAMAQAFTRAFNAGASPIKAMREAVASAHPDAQACATCNGNRWLGGREIIEGSSPAMTRSRDIGRPCPDCSPANHGRGPQPTTFLDARTEITIPCPYCGAPCDMDAIGPHDEFCSGYGPHADTGPDEPPEAEA